MVPDAGSPADEDLQRLAERFVAYAVGDATSFPHAQTISLSIGGRAAGSLEGTGAALTDRGTWGALSGRLGDLGAASCQVGPRGPSSPPW